MNRIFLFPLFFVLASCSLMFQETAEKEEKPSRELIEKISFKDVMAVVFKPKCISCHGNAGGVNVESYQNARAFLREIERSTLIQKRMPKTPFPPLTREEMLILRAWIEAGGPDNTPVGEVPDSEGPSELLPTFESIRTRILEPKCIVCHKPGGKASDIPLMTKEDLIDSPLEIVIPGNPEESMLMIVFQEDARKPMPPPQSGISPLTTEEKAIVEKWISDGAN